MSSDEELPLLTLLSRATQRERETLVAALGERGFDDVALTGARIVAAVEEGEKSIQELAEATGTTKQFAAREVQKVARARYVAVQPSAEDRRVSLVRLAPRGKELMLTARKIKRSLDAAVERKIGSADVKTLRRILARLLED